jgi:hypothetical protein
MSQPIVVTVKDFSVTHCIDAKSKTEVPTKFKPKAVTALKGVQVDPPKGKTLGPYSVDIAVAIKAVPNGLRAEVEIICNNQDPYSKKDKFVARATGGATVPTDKPDKGDTEAAVEAALNKAIDTAINGIKADAKKP